MSALAADYEHCRRIAARHGRTYYLATALLAKEKRPHVYALYAFARRADDVVDGAGTPAEQERGLAELEAALRDGAPDPVVRAVRATVARYDLPAAHFADFFASMRLDLSVGEYASWTDLLGYMHGSAGVIGLQLLPVLGVVAGGERAAPAYAAELGYAFQLTNFIRDVGEDLRRGRVYLPREDLDRFEVSRELLASGVVDGRVRRLLAFEIARARELYRNAATGIRLLAPESRDCVATALAVYRGILDAVERADYQVLDRRVSVAGWRRALVAGPAYARAVRARSTRRGSG